MGKKQVKQIKRFTSLFRSMAFEDDAGEEQLSYLATYDDKGNILEEHRLKDEEDTETKITYRYNDAGFLIEEIHDMTGEGFMERYNYDRDEKNRILTFIKFYGDEEGEKVVYTYSSHDNPVTIDRFDSDGDPETSEIVEYNTKDLAVKHTVKKITEDSIEITSITYNERDLPVEKIISFENGDNAGSVILEYNDENEVVKITERNEKGKVVSEIVNTYDERKNVIERTIRDFNSRRVKFEYDDRDNCISEEVFDEYGNLSMRRTYEYDEFNNPVAESLYRLDISRTGFNKNASSRYEYEYW